MAQKKKKKTAPKKKDGKKTQKRKNTASSAKKKKKSMAKKTTKSKKGPKKKSTKPKKPTKPKKKPIKQIAQEATQKKEESRRKKLLRKLKKGLGKEYRGPIIAIASFLALFLLFHVASLVLTFSLYNTVLPGTTVAGIDISSLTLDEVQIKLMERGQPFLDSSIPVTLDGETRNFTPEELGISLLTRNTLNEVELVDYKKTNIATIVTSMIKKRDIPFYVSVDIQKAQKNIEEHFAFADKKSSNAYVTFESGILTIVPEKPGKVIETRKLYKDIKTRANNLSSDAFTVTTEGYQPLVTQERLESELEAIEGRLYDTLSLTYENWNWNLKLSDHLDWIRFEYQDRFHFGDIASFDVGILEDKQLTVSSPLRLSTELSMVIKPAPFLTYVENEISPILESKPQNVSIYKDENDEIIIEGKGKNGQTIVDKYLIEGMNLAINNNIDEIPIPVHVSKAHVDVEDELKTLGIETLIGTGRSAFAGSPPNRIHNIKDRKSVV